MRIIDEEDKNLGVMSKTQAQALAEEKGLDLVEVESRATPPVVRIISFDKFRYLKEKEEKRERRLSQKASDLKQVRITARAAKNDLETRLRKLVEFLEHGNPVEIMMKLRGREKRNKEWAFQKMDEFLKMIPIEYRVVSTPKWSGFGISVQITKK